MQQTVCRACGAPLESVMVDLGTMPLANSYVRHEDLDRPEPAFPLRAMVCDACLLVQLDTVADPGAIFSEYAYFSSYSPSWVAHAARYVEEITDRLRLTGASRVLEIASNDGYLLQHFITRGIPCLGIEPAANVAAAAVAAGVPTRVAFFGLATARQLVTEQMQADLIVGNNVLAHVPALVDFVGGVRAVLKPAGVATFEFPHLLRLLQERQFDTIYHEHFSYFSLIAAARVFAAAGLQVFDVAELPTHGGSLRLFVQHAGGPHRLERHVAEVMEREEAAGLRRIKTYAEFGRAVEQVRAELVAFLDRVRAEGATVAAYGAPAKGNTLLNYCGIGTERIQLTVDLNPHKQGHYLPGSRIPVAAPDALRALRPEYVIILPWNLRDEIMRQVAWVGEWGGRFVVPIPRLTVVPAPGVAPA